MILKDIQNIENKELIKNCLIRAKLMELLALEKGMKDMHLEYFMAGVFSSIDILLNRNMKEIVEELPLTPDVKQALIGKDNEIKKVLDIVVSYERANWHEVEINTFFPNITQERFMIIYIEALKWAMKLNY